jgi:hypothetical protein
MKIRSITTSGESCLSQEERWTGTLLVALQQVLHGHSNHNSWVWRSFLRWDRSLVELRLYRVQHQGGLLGLWVRYRNHRHRRDLQHIYRGVLQDSSVQPLWASASVLKRFLPLGVLWQYHRRHFIFLWGPLWLRWCHLFCGSSSWPRHSCCRGIILLRRALFITH